jgi:hypothetical protein
MRSINPKHQKTFDKYIVADRHHVGLETFYDNWINEVDNEAQAMKLEAKKLEAKKERITSKTYSDLCELWEQLPKREQLNLDKQYLARFGYSAQMGDL